jgi:hypothetical protein
VNRNIYAAISGVEMVSSTTDPAHGGSTPFRRLANLLPVAAALLWGLGEHLMPCICPLPLRVQQPFWW